jgi:hypothetical protein
MAHPFNNTPWQARRMASSQAVAHDGVGERHASDSITPPKTKGPLDDERPSVS